MATVISASKLIQLLRSAGPAESTFVRILDDQKLAVGSNPLQPTHEICFTSEKVLKHSANTLRVDSEAPSAFAKNYNVGAGGRRMGSYYFELHDQKVLCTSVKDTLKKSLVALENRYPGTLERLSRNKGRTRRIVARERKQLFDKPHLVEAYSEQLMNGWWVGTNNSTAETVVWLKRAAECAGLKWGRDFKADEA